MKIQKSV